MTVAAAFAVFTLIFFPISGLHAQMLDAAPVVQKKAPLPQPALPVPPPTAQADPTSPSPYAQPAQKGPASPPPAAPVAEAEEGLEGTTTKDYSYYLKSGDKSPNWNEFIEPAFQTFDSNNMATASIFMQRAYDQGCRDPLLLFRYGIFLESKGDYKGAAEMMMETARGVESRYPGHPLTKSIHRHAGRALYRVGRYDDALKELTEALKVEKDDFMLLYMSGQILHAMGELQKSRLILEKAALVTPPAGMEADTARPLLHELVIVTNRMGDIQACEIYLTQLLAMFPDDPVGLQYRRELEKLKNKAREREILKDIVN